jgi:cysteine desulfurase
MNNIYLDNAATTQIDPRVLDAMMPFLQNSYGNPSSAHSFGRDAKVLLEDAREVIAEFIGAKPDEINFTSGGTEADNFAVKGISLANYKKRNHIISTQIEHSAVLDSLNYLKDSFGFEISCLSSDKFGRIDINELSKLIRNETFLICIMHSNNEIGVINDIKAVSELIGDRGIYLHTDSVQSIGKTYFNVREVNCSTAALSSHKIYGPKGIGSLYIKRNITFEKFIHGGKQELDHRGGTENIPGIAGFKKAVEILKDEMAEDIKNYSYLKHHFLFSLKENFGNKIFINSLEKEDSLPNIVNITFDSKHLKLDPDELLIKLDTKGIAVSTGSACTSGSVKPSHVLKALGYDDESARLSLRVSFGRFNKIKDVDTLLNELTLI